MNLNIPSSSDKMNPKPRQIKEKQTDRQTDRDRGSLSLQKHEDLEDRIQISQQREGSHGGTPHSSLHPQTKTMKWRISLVGFRSLTTSARVADVNSDEENGHERYKIISNNRFPLSHWEIVILFFVFALFSVALLSIFWTMPQLDTSVLVFPRNLVELRVLK